MKNQTGPSVSTLAQTFAAAPFVCLVLLALVAPLRAQTGGPLPRPPESDPQRQDKLNRFDMRDREWALEHSRKTVKPPLTREQKQTLLRQIAEDFERLQLANNEMLQAASSSQQSLDYKRISALAAEIRKRAARLRENLSLPETKPTPKTDAQQAATAGGRTAPQAATEVGQSAPAGASTATVDERHEPAAALDVRAAVSLLDGSIASFVNSPVFQSNSGVIDINLVTRAAYELNRIINLSGDLQKEAARAGRLARE